MDGNIEIPQVVFVRYRCDARDPAKKYRLVCGSKMSKHFRTYGSAKRRSVSFMILFGKAIVYCGRNPARLESIYARVNRKAG
jgi:hypothetical protein